MILRVFELGNKGVATQIFLFSPLFGEAEPNLTSIFFRWVGSTTNQVSNFVGDFVGGF